MKSGLRKALFTCFVVSGFAGLIYQIVWVRMALASFGVITPFASVVISVFMLGLALGTWLGGRFAETAAQKAGVSPLILYAGLEALIGLSAFALPPLFDAARQLLLPVGGMESGAYLAASSVMITLTMLPWCVAMGATFPTMMAFIGGIEKDPSGSFSYLYLANVMGAFMGAVATPIVLIEQLGFSGSLLLAAGLNFSISVGCLLILTLTSEKAKTERAEKPAPPLLEPRFSLDITPALSLTLLFFTGFITMAYEIVWMRAFTPVLGTLVYAFSGLLAVYLVSTFLGSALYRRHQAQNQVLPMNSFALLLPLAALLPVGMVIPKFLGAVAQPLIPLAAFFGGTLELRGAMIPVSLLSIAPFCAMLGYLTPMLVDHYGRGAPQKAGRAYAMNIAGSILGPIVAAYLLLPGFGSRVALLLLTLPFAGLLILYAFRTHQSRVRIGAAIVGILLSVGFFQMGWRGHSFEEGSHIPNPVVRRDHTATVISFGQGFNRHLLVNGYGMTVLTPLTKIMAHLPLATVRHPPENALVIAFGMGTTFRSMLSWNIDATAVELVPGVVDAFGYYHDDADAILKNPQAHIFIDDGRRFLARTQKKFDVITLDPPPPVETAGSSLLYANEFYTLAKRRMTPDGILHQWFPDGIQVEPEIRHAVLRSAADAFPFIRIYQSHHGFGLHILLSRQPIEVPTPEEFIERLPPEALADLMEWAPPGTEPSQFIQEQVLERELALETLTGPAEGPRISDDQPFNEYFVMRRWMSARTSSEESNRP